MINLNSLLNIKIDKIYCISLKSRQDRRDFLKTQFEKLDHQVHFHIVERNKDPIRGCLESHIECIKEAKELNYQNILMLEDDILIDEKNLENIKPLHIPSDFDMFYLGYHVNNGQKYGQNIIKLLSAQTTHAYIMNQKCFNYVLNNIEKDWTEISEWSIRNKYESLTNFNVKAIDLFYSKHIHHHRMKSYGIYPMLIKQRPDFSDIENRQIDYRDLMDGKAKEFYLVEPYKYDIWVLNLNKRKDRWGKMEELIGDNDLNAYRINAIDGSTFNFEKYKDLFSLRDFRLRNKNPYKTHEYGKGVLGCALSHYKMWETICNNKSLSNEDFILIIEDDCHFIDNFKLRLNLLIDELKYKNWDICYIGYTDFVAIESDKEEGNLIKLSGERRLRGGGTFGYFITKAGAKKFYDLANDRNIQQAVDWFMIEQYERVNAYKVKQDLVFSNVAGVEGHDSDVQNVIKPFYDIKMEYYKFNENNFFKDQYNNLYRIDDPFVINYLGNLVDENKIEIKRFGKQIVKTKFSFKRGSEYVGIYVGKNMKIFTHYLAKYLQNQRKKQVIVFYDGFDFTIDGIQYIQKEKFDKLNNALKFTRIFVLDIQLFLYNYVKDWNKITIMDDGEIFFNIKYDNITLPNYGTNLLENVLDKVDNIIGLSETNNHYLKARMGLQNEIGLMPPIFKENDIFKDENEINLKSDDVLLISYDSDVKSIINFFHTLNIKNKKLLVFSDVFKSIDENIFIKSKIFRCNLSYLRLGTFFITQNRFTDTYYALNLALNYGLVCIIPEYYRELSNKTITFRNSLNEVKTKVESCITTPTKKKIYKNIGQSHARLLEKQLLELKL